MFSRLKTKINFLFWDENLPNIFYVNNVNFSDIMMLAFSGQYRPGPSYKFKLLKQRDQIRLSWRKHHQVWSHSAHSRFPKNGLISLPYMSSLCICWFWQDGKLRHLIPVPRVLGLRSAFLPIQEQLWGRCMTIGNFLFFLLFQNIDPDQILTTAIPTSWLLRRTPTPPESNYPYNI